MLLQFKKYHHLLLLEACSWHKIWISSHSHAQNCQIRTEFRIHTKHNNKNIMPVAATMNYHVRNFSCTELTTMYILFWNIFLCCDVRWDIKILNSNLSWKNQKKIWIFFCHTLKWNRPTLQITADLFRGGGTDFGLGRQQKIFKSRNFLHKIFWLPYI